MDLQELKDVGAIASSLEKVVVNQNDSVSIGEVLSVSNLDEREKFRDRAVTVNNPVWVATSKRRALQEASSVYSCDKDGIVGCWKGKKNEFLFMELSNDNRLLTMRRETIFKEREDIDMPSLESLGNVNSMEAFDQDLGTLLGGGDVGSLGGTPSSGEQEAGESSKGKARAEAEKTIKSIRSAVNSINLANTDDIVLNNRQHGRFIAFITPNDGVVKLKKVKKPLLDANNNRQLDNKKIGIEGYDQQLKLHGSDHKYSLKFCLTETSLEFVDSKPGTPKGAIIATPAGSEISLTSVTAKETFTADRSKQDLLYRIMSKDAAFMYILSNYGGTITESSDIMGPEAGKITINKKGSTKNLDSGEFVQTVRMSFALEKGSTVRKSLLTRKNIFPAKLYKTISVAAASDEEKSSLNYNIEFIVSKDNVLSELDAKSAEKVQVADDGTVTSDWINKNLPITVQRFDATTDDDMVLDVKLPLRSKKPTKSDPNKFTYPYQYVEIGEPDGPEAQPEYKKIIELTGLPEDAFLKRIKEITSASGRRVNKDVSLTNEDTLRAMFSGNVDVGFTKSIAALAEEIQEIG